MKKNQTRDNGFCRVDKVIRKVAKDHRLEQVLYKHKTLKSWAGVAGAFVEEAKEQTQAIDFRRGVLIVACLSKNVAYKLKMLASRIISALNQYLGRQVVFALQVEI